jgi:hypothetical protein
MKLCARALLVLLPLVVTIPVAPASAQEADAADALFQKGKEEMKNKNYKAACAFFRGSYKLDPAPGALHALAVCHVEAGEVASAVMRLDEYLSIFEKLPPPQRAKHEERAKSAREQRAALAPQVPEVTIVLPARAPPGTRVFQDSVELRAVSLGIGLPIDPGEHVVTTQAPGGPVNEHRFKIQKGEKKRLELTVSGLRQAEPSPLPSPPQAEHGKGDSGPRPGAQSQGERPTGLLVGGDAVDRGGGSGMSGYRIGAFVAGGIGAAALVAGIVTGTLAAGKTSAIEEGCRDIEPGRARCTPDGLSAAQDAQSFGLISTIGFVIGGAGLATGTLIVLLEPSKKLSESHGRRRGTLIGVGLTGAGSSAWTAGVKGAW